MFYCEECAREFKSKAGYAMHMKAEHGERLNAPKSRETIIYPCPVCLFQLPFTTGLSVCSLTCCPRCLAMYNPQSGELMSPPPEHCMAERAGHPCNNPGHKAWHKRYQESLA